MKPTIKVSEKIWTLTIEGLAKRSAGIKESACIWAGKRNEHSWQVTETVYLDDLPGTKGLKLQHKTPQQASNQLFAYLRSKNLQIIADLHTHPGNWVELSIADKHHPIEFRVGLLAFVFPYFVQKPFGLADMGVHEYLGNCKWRRLNINEVNNRIEISGGK